MACVPRARLTTLSAVMAGLGLLVSGGCLSVPIPQAEADPARFYVLNTTSAPAVGGNGEAAVKAPVMQLQPVDVASYLKSRPMIVRRGENEIQFREFARWGEPLELGIARVLREELLARGAASEVRTSGAGAGQALSVRVLACEGGADGSVYFRAVWELTKAGADTKGEALGRGDFRAQNLRWDGKSEASVARQLSAAVGALAAEITAAARK